MSGMRMYNTTVNSSIHRGYIKSTEAKKVNLLVNAEKMSELYRHQSDQR